MPINKQPVILTRNVPQGKEDRNIFCTYLVERNLAILPRNPPEPIINNVFSIYAWKFDINIPNYYFDVHQNIWTLYLIISILQRPKFSAVDQTEMFYSLIRELVSSNNIDRLIFFKKQIESDISRIGFEERLMGKYNLVCKAIEQLQDKKSA